MIERSSESIEGIDIIRFDSNSLRIMFYRLVVFVLQRISLCQLAVGIPVFGVIVQKLRIICDGLGELALFGTNI